MHGVAIWGFYLEIGIWGRRPEFEVPPNQWWIVYHFFLLWYHPAQTQRQSETWKCTPDVNGKSTKRSFLFLVWGARKDLLRVRDGERNPNFFSFFPSFLPWPPGSTILVASSCLAMTVATGKAPKTEGEELLFSPKGLWSPEHGTNSIAFFHCLSCCLALDADAVRVWQSGENQSPGMQGCFTIFENQSV